MLRQQLEVLKREKLAELKRAGVEYESASPSSRSSSTRSRSASSSTRPSTPSPASTRGCKGDDVRPKSIAREMFERFMDFNEYVREYELGRAEGTLLRYLSDVYKALVQTVPAPAKTPEIEEIEVFLRAMVRAVDSSLLDEWERMRAEPERGAPGGGRAAGAGGAGHHARRARVHGARAQRDVPVHPGPRAARLGRRRGDVRRRGRAWRAPARGDGRPVERRALRAGLQPYFEEHPVLRTDPAARAPDNTRVTKTGRGTWEVVQVLSDAEGEEGEEGESDWTLDGRGRSRGFGQDGPPRTSDARR